ncbi:MAG: nucleotidyltransferase family protein [Anaerolineales bacterium]|nr:nucleotidyltransferase family protein [Anaerolineales bacterium]
MGITVQTLGALLSENQNVNLDSFSSEDWEALAQRALTEGVAPLAYWILSKSGKISALPKSTRQILRGAYFSTWAQNQKIFDELEKLASAFRQADIPVILLKGACFALTIYPDIGLRPMGDLDLLVPASKLDEAVEIAKTLGYIDETPEASTGLRDLLDHEICLQKKDVALEIHKSLVAEKTFKYAAPVDWFWSQTEALKIPRFANLLTLTPAAQVLYAATHAMLQHGGRSAPLRWFVDIDRLLRFYADRLDWEALLSQAKIFEWSSALNAALAQTQDYFKTPIPAEIRERLSKGTDRHANLIEQLQSKPLTRAQEEGQKMMALNTYGRIRLLLALIVPSPAYMRWRYRLKTAWALPVYYLLRWLGILKDGIRALIMLVQSGRAARR